MIISLLVQTVIWVKIIIFVVGANGNMTKNNLISANNNIAKNDNFSNGVAKSDQFPSWHQQQYG
jgi:hypothetical protein